MAHTGLPKRGGLPSRWRTFDAGQIEMLHALYYDPDVSVGKIAKAFDVSTSTLFRWIDQLGWTMRRVLRQEAGEALIQHGEELHAAWDRPEMFGAGSVEDIRANLAALQEHGGPDGQDEGSASGSPHLAEPRAGVVSLSPHPAELRAGVVSLSPHPEEPRASEASRRTGAGDMQPILRDTGLRPAPQDEVPDTADSGHHPDHESLQLSRMMFRTAPQGEGDAGGGALPECAPPDLLASVESAVRREIAVLRARMRDMSAGAGERNARTLASLVRTLKAVTDMQMSDAQPADMQAAGMRKQQEELAAGAKDAAREPPPRSLAQLREDLAARLDKLVEAKRDPTFLDVAGI